MLGNITKLSLLRRSRLRLWSIRKHPLHQRALDLPGGGDEGVLGGDLALDGVEDVGDAALFVEGGEGDESGFWEIQLFYGNVSVSLDSILQLGSSSL